MIDALLNTLAISLSVWAIYLTSCSKKDWVRRAGCCVGIAACAANLYLQVGNAPWSTWLLSVACLGIYVKGADVPGLIKKVIER